MDHTDLNTTQETLTVPSELVIPEISDERLQELYSQIRPIVDIEGEKFTLKAYSLNEIKNTSYF
jgi:hypothetical protein